MLLCPLKGKNYGFGGFRYTQGYGTRPDVYAQFGLKGHNGYDFAPLIPGSRGVVVYAPHDGYAKCIMGDAGYGNYVELLSMPRTKEGVRLKSDLAHLASFMVPNGAFVAMGDPIGIMGSTGFADGIHLHWSPKRADRAGNTLDKGNGYGGALPIGKWILLYDGSTLIS